MTRLLRLEFEGACYHVINRGNYRRDIFSPQGAAEAFERCLFEAAGMFGWRIHAFVLMRNHYHLAVETPQPSLSAGMKWLQGTWAARFNRYRGVVGRPFQGRYKALHVEPGHALAQVCHYIHLNPVRAKAVATDELAQHRWSSLHWLASKDRPEFLVAKSFLAESGGLADTSAGWRKYREYLGTLAEEDLARRSERTGRLSRGWVVGTAEFKQSLRAELRDQGADLEHAALLGVGAVPELRSATWEEQLGRTANALGIDLAKLGANKSSPDKVRLAAVMKRGTAASNGWLATRLAMGQPASVSQFVRRFRLAGGMDDAKFQRALSRVKV